MTDNELLKAKLQTELSEISKKSTFSIKDTKIAQILTEIIGNIDKMNMFENGEYPNNSISVQTIPQNTVSYDSGSDFSKMVHGKDSTKIWKIVEELVESLSITLPELYNAVCEKFRDI